MNDLMKNFFEKLRNLESFKSRGELIDKIIAILEKRLDLSPLMKLTFKFNITSKIKMISKDFHNYGVLDRVFNENDLLIEVATTKKLLPFIILREIYIFAFIPEGLRENTTIQAIIHQIIINDLKGLDGCNTFKKIIGKYFVELYFLNDTLDRIGQFIKTREEKRFIFSFLRENYSFLRTIDERIYMKLFYERNFLKNDSLIPDDDLIEVIRILVEIFYKMKKFDSLKNYKNYFKDIRSDNKNIRNLSLRKFSKMIGYLKKYHYLAPTYLLNWPKFNIKLLVDTFNFSRNLRISSRESIEKVPFSLQGKGSRNSFSFALSSFIVIPEIYLNDFIGLVRKLEDLNIFINKQVMLIEELIIDFLNLNYFREFNYPRSQLINPKSENYDSKYEITFKMKYIEKSEQVGLTLLEFLILDRIRYISITGFGFERKRKLFNMIKSDLLHLLTLRQKVTNNLINNVKKFQNNLNLRKKFTQFLKLNKKKSFYTILEFLKDLKTSLQLIKKELNKNDLKVYHDFSNELLEKEIIIENIEEKVILKNKSLRSHLYKYYFPIIIESKESFEEEIQIIDEFYQLLLTFKNAHILNIDEILDIIENKSLLESLISDRKQKLKIFSQTFNDLSIQKIRNTLNKFLKRELIKPYLINTVFTSTFTSFFPQLILKYNQDSKELINQIKKFFPRIIVFKVLDLVNEEECLLVEFYIPPLKEEEKKLFVSIILNLFMNDIIGLKRFFFSGILETFSLIDYYDFDSTKFEYNPYIFQEYYHFIRDKVANFKISKSKSFNWKNFKNFWLKEKDIYELINTIKTRITNEQIEFNPKLFRKLIDFHMNLDNILLNKEHFMDIKKKEYFIRYVDSLLFIPIYQNFGLSQYFLYICPENLDEIDYKLLFLNTFQEVKYPAELAPSIPLFIKYIFPYRNPNNAYFNWLVKSKRSIREYALFYVQKIYFILNFNYNLQPYGWHVDYKKFKIYLDNILVNKGYQIETRNIKSCKVGNLNTSNYRGPTSEDYKTLLRIYNTKPSDIKSLTSFLYKNEFQSVQSLLENGLIYPFLKLKNLDFKEIIYIIAPDIKKEDIKKIVQIFNFFNYCFIYEISGDYFIQGDLEEKTYEHGVMVELYLPGNTQFGELFKLFDLMFSVMNVENYIIMHDLVDGESLIKNTFNRIDLSEYNPLKNLKWNDIDKIWINPKIYGEFFNPIYPDLVKED
jgi:hypothetical protein